MKGFVVKFITEDSPEYLQACQLRYELFFAEHNLPDDVALDRVANSFHCAIVSGAGTVAYGRLKQQSDVIYQIQQMVVAPEYQRKGLGTQIMRSLIALARQKQAREIILDARITAVPFYEKLGFTTFGSEHPSPTTGVPHIYMKINF